MCETFTSTNDKLKKWWRSWFNDYLLSIHRKLFDTFNVDVAAMGQRWGQNGKKWCRMGVKAKMGVNYVKLVKDV